MIKIKREEDSIVLYEDEMPEVEIESYRNYPNTTEYELNYSIKCLALAIIFHGRG